MNPAVARRPSTREMQRACLARDPSYDGIFFLAVRTTGVFCRPSCSARKPRPENVEFFPNAAAAVRAGYRPCRRCRPLQIDGAPPAWVVRLLEHLATHAGKRLRDADLRALEIDPARARRYFKRHFGMTFQAYHRTRRLSGAMAALSGGADLMETGYAHGYDSPSGFREAFERVFGGPPGRKRSAGCLAVDWFESPLGPLVAGATPAAVCLLEFADPGRLELTAKRLHDALGCAVVPGRNAHLDTLRGQLAGYFAGRLRSFSVPLTYPGTSFQQSVWRALLEIPYGQTISYEELARRVGRPGAQRAVGLANGCNRIAIVIPCHRVVNKSGQLGGYGGGLWRKQFLLDLEHNVQPFIGATAARRAEARA